jgi:glycine cleavage system H protein
MSVLRFTKEHEWILFDKGTGTVGITDYATGKLGDIVYVELPKISQKIARGAEAATVESVKAASEVYAPCSGAVTAINQAIADQPGLVNDDPMGNGWFFKMSLDSPGELSGLMEKEAYDEYVKGLD